MAQKFFNIKIKSTSLTASNASKVAAWYQNNTGMYPAKVLLKRNGRLTQAEIDGQPIGNIVDQNGKVYACPDFTFDDKGVCTDDYEFVILSVEPTVAPAAAPIINAALTLSVIETIQEETFSTHIFDEEVKRIVDEGICDEATVRENIAIMALNHVTPENIQIALELYKKWDVPVHKCSTVYIPVDGNYFMNDALTSIFSGRGLLLEGGQSVGKNVLIENIAQVLHRPYTLITVGPETNRSDLYGAKDTKQSEAYKITKEMVLAAMAGDKDAAATLETIKARSATVQIQMNISEVITAIRDGWVICFNELNLIDPGLFSSFANQILDGTGFIVINGYGRVDVHPMTAIIGSQNPGAVGTQKQNTPTMTRFDTLQFGFPKTVLEILKAAVAGELRQKERRWSAIGQERMAARFRRDVTELENAIWVQCDKLHMECVQANQEKVIGDAAVNIRGMVAAIVQHLALGADLKHRIQINVGNNACMSDADKATYSQKLNDRF